MEALTGTLSYHNDVTLDERQLLVRPLIVRGVEVGIVGIQCPEVAERNL